MSNESSGLFAGRAGRAREDADFQANPGGGERVSGPGGPPEAGRTLEPDAGGDEPRGGDEPMVPTRNPRDGVGAVRVTSGTATHPRSQLGDPADVDTALFAGPDVDELNGPTTETVWPAATRGAASIDPYPGDPHEARRRVRASAAGAVALGTAAVGSAAVGTAAMGTGAAQRSDPAMPADSEGTPPGARAPHPGGPESASAGTDPDRATEAPAATAAPARALSRPALVRPALVRPPLVRPPLVPPGASRVGAVRGGTDWVAPAAATPAPVDASAALPPLADRPPAREAGVPERPRAAPAPETAPASDGRTTDGRTTDGRTTDGRTTDDRTTADRQIVDRQTYRAPGEWGAEDRGRSTHARNRGDLARVLVLLGLAAAVIGLAWTLLVRDGGSTDRVAATPPSASQPPAAPSPGLAAAPAAGPAAAPDEPAAAAPRTPTSDALLPAGWSTYRAPGGSFTLGLPPEWTPFGDPADQRFISSSRLTTVSVRSAAAGPRPEPAFLETDETEFAAQNAGYLRLSAVSTEHRGSPARRWDYTAGTGAQARRGSVLGVLVGDRAYWLEVESKASSWRFAEPLVKRFQGNFVPA